MVDINVDSGLQGKYEGNKAYTLKEVNNDTIWR